ncbi:hypothetical protein SYNPS1DRAFT_26583 [Syncephalis pseudoplumigaleata]|uniref:Uncharacterized protein n=1 Tax=Syncephalis pseudoplumigaleata TaxID=1712513 RepID=A0A4P9Z5E2_9FUNG|nr:hypothetical protein SYNPS1DRAFT_26583 [Syncephalis pseudoplumigaleata]|eukprot:RKP27776.1 hypothetical protein SYNPS1DRAFT_26583 [Syncephalis pseudoplumigaleata]
MQASLLLVALFYVAGNVHIESANATPQAIPAAAAATSSALTSPDRLYNPSEDANLTTYKLRQWTQNPKDKAWCMSIATSANSSSSNSNSGSQVGLHEEECSLMASHQNMQFWPLVAQSEYYKFRFRDTDQCLSAVANSNSQVMPMGGQQQQQPAAATSQNIATPAHAMLKRRRLQVDLSSFHDVLAHGGHPALEATHASAHLKRRNVINSDMVAAAGVPQGANAGGPNTNVNIEGVATGAPPVQQAPAGGAATLMLSNCIDSNAQVFQARIVEKPGGLKNKYYQIMSHTSMLCITGGNGRKGAGITLAPCRANDDAQLWLLEDIQQSIKDTDTTHTIIEYASTFQLANFEERLGLRRGHAINELTPEEVDKLDETMPGASDVIGMAFDLAEAIRAYVEDTAQYQRSGAPLVPKLVGIFLKPDDYPTAWDNVWGITKTVLSFVPLPGIADIVKFGPVSAIDQITQEVNDRRKNKPPLPSELNAWTEFALRQCDFTADSLYKSFLELFRQARIGQLRTLLDEFRAGKYNLSADDFYRRYQASFLKQLVATKGDGGFWVSVCENTNCQGRLSVDKLNSHSRMYNSFYTSNMPEAAVDYLVSLGEHDNFYAGRDGWVAERFYYTCQNGHCPVRLRMAPGSNKLERV